jgi:tetratricopeptide (TPR) repeat protein
MSDPGGGASSGWLQRGMLLKQQRRYAEAESYFRDALSQNPNDAFAFMQLAQCQLQLPNRARDALESIGRALAIEPNEAPHHAMRAFILCVLHRTAEALKSADAGIELDPSSSYCFTARAQALLELERWRDAEAAARQALALDADNSSAANQLAHALRLQNKMAENAGHIAGMLARDPEDASTHCSAGWAALQRGRHRVAEQHFLEALRLEPESEYARQGLLNSFRARSPFYRGYLAYCFWLQQIGRKMRIAFVVGVLVFVNFARVMFMGPLAPLATVAFVVYLLFVLWVWLARPAGNFILLFDRFARHALKRAEKIEAMLVGGALCVGLPLLVTGASLQSLGLSFPAISLIASAFPMSMTLTNPSKAGRIIFGGIGSFCMVTFIALLAAVFLPVSDAASQILLGMFSLSIFGAIATTWLGNVPALRRGSS